MQAYMGNPAEVARKAQHYPMRMPSDQFQMLLHAINPNQPSKTVHATMPPPPLPAAVKRHPYPFNADPTLNGDAPQQDVPLIPLAPSPRQSFGPNLVNVMDRRAESRYSDVSMHNGCTSFPRCTTEDEDGQIVHSTPSAPSTVVKGRKEGSSPTKRKSNSGKAKNDQAEKKLRRSSRLLQHDSGYVGEPSDVNDDGDTQSKGTGIALVQSGRDNGQEAHKIGAKILEHQ